MINLIKNSKFTSKMFLCWGEYLYFFNYFVLSVLSLIIETPFINFSTTREYASIFLFVSLFFLVGLFDDKYNSKPFSKILILIFISLKFIE